MENKMIEHTEVIIIIIIIIISTLSMKIIIKLFLFY